MHDLVKRLQTLPADTLTALAFTSRLPVATGEGPLDLRRAAGAWPAAGFVLALGPALVFLITRAADFPAAVSAILALALFVALTGAMHEDGLADTFDGAGGGSSAEKRLAIMRDSRLGSFGALALLFAVLVKVAALTAIGASLAHGVLALVAAAMVSRALALWHWSETPSARSEGMAATAGQPDSLALTVGLGTGAVAALALLIGFGVAALIGLLMAAAAIGIFSQAIVRRLGGHTGDTIGAAQQLAEALLYAGLSAGWASLHL